MNTALKTAALATLSVGIAGEAFAQSTTATQDVNITAAVGPSCLINGIATPSALANPVTVNSFGYVVPAPTNHTVNNVVCNVPATVGTQTINGAVTTAGAAPPGFQNNFDYLAFAQFGGAASFINTATVGPGGTGSFSSTTPSAASGNLTIDVFPSLNTLPLMPGAYQDTLRVTLTPSP